MDIKLLKQAVMRKLAVRAPKVPPSMLSQIGDALSFKKARGHLDKMKQAPVLGGVFGNDMKNRTLDAYNASLRESALAWGGTGLAGYGLKKAWGGDDGGRKAIIL